MESHVEGTEYPPHCAAFAFAFVMHPPPSTHSRACQLTRKCARGHRGYICPPYSQHIRARAQKQTKHRKGHTRQRSRSSTPGIKKRSPGHASQSSGSLWKSPHEFDGEDQMTKNRYGQDIATSSPRHQRRTSSKPLLPPRAASTPNSRRNSTRVDHDLPQFEDI